MSIVAERISAPVAPPRERYRVTVDQYVRFQTQGYLVVPGLVPLEDVEELRQHTEDLMQGRLSEQQNRMPERDTSRDTGGTLQPLEAPPDHLSPTEKAQYFLRIHMLHRRLELHERYLLHPRVLDVLEAIIGPDILAMQTMLFLKPPGKPGQGWHQDSYYIPTHPDTLCGAWIAIDECDELNGAMWFAAGSQHEPVYPPREGGGFGYTQLRDIGAVQGVSHTDDDQNDLSRVAAKYPHLLVPARPGDVVFFGGHVLHRSKPNFTTDRFRRAFVSHYSSARSFTQWGANIDSTDPHSAPAVDPITKMTNGSHILARGDTHLPFARPRFGTPCAATLPPDEREREREIALAARGNAESGMMDMTPANTDRTDDGY